LGGEKENGRDPMRILVQHGYWPVRPSCFPEHLHGVPNLTDRRGIGDL
jgi:hypothetical protein